MRMRARADFGVACACADKSLAPVTPRTAPLACASALSIDARAHKMRLIAAIVNGAVAVARMGTSLCLRFSDAHARPSPRTRQRPGATGRDRRLGRAPALA